MNGGEGARSWTNWREASRAESGRRPPDKGQCKAQEELTVRQEGAPKEVRLLREEGVKSRGEPQDRRPSMQEMPAPMLKKLSFLGATFLPKTIQCHNIKKLLVDSSKVKETVGTISPGVKVHCCFSVIVQPDPH